MEKNTNKAPKLLLILVIGWVPLRILRILLAGSWFSIGFFSDALITLLAVLAGLVLLILSIVVAVISLFRWLVRRERPPVVAFLPLVIMLIVDFSAARIPSKPAMIFYLHRDEFIALANSSISKFQDTQSGFRLPESPLYKSAAADRDFYSGEFIIEFILDDFYLPLMYLSTDNPSNTYGACSGDGGPLERLEPKWYVCRRDWN